MRNIITTSLLEMVVEVVRPAVERILEAPGTTWGPKWVTGFVSAPNAGTIAVSFGKEPKVWKKKWGEKKDFVEIAKRKLELAERNGLPTSVVVALIPWMIEKDEYLYAGGTWRGGIGAAMSGANGRTDEGISELIVDTVRMFAFLETDSRIKSKEMKI